MWRFDKPFIAWFCGLHARCSAAPRSNPTAEGKGLVARGVLGADVRSKSGIARTISFSRGGTYGNSPTDISLKHEKLEDDSRVFTVLAE